MGAVSQLPLPDIPKDGNPWIGLESLDWVTQPNESCTREILS